MGRLAFWILLLCTFGASAAQVENLRVWHAPDQSRLVFDLSGPTSFDVFAVGGPHRVVVDLKVGPNSKPLAMPREFRARILGLRQGRRDADTLRVVFDLSHEVSIRHALLAPHPPYGHRLVVDLLDPEGPVASTAAPPASARPAQSPPSAAPVVQASASRAPSAASDNTETTTKVTYTGRQYVIAIDAGHGGEDVGAIGQRGTYEKTVVLALARELAALINQEPNMRAVLIRDGDYYIGLRDRMVRARKHRADLFVSVHADAFHNRRVRGSSVYVLSRNGASSEAARWIAERENASDLAGGVTLDDKDSQLRTVLLDMSQTASMQASLDVAGNVLQALHRVGAVHRQQVQSAGFMVLKSPDIPSLLVETAFISNPEEERQLKDPKFRRNVASAIRTGIKAYFSSVSEPGQRTARARQHRVEPGDTLSGIAELYDVRPQQILAANNRRDQVVRLGEILRIP